MTKGEVIELGSFPEVVNSVHHPGDADYDPVCFNFSENDHVAITQTDEFGRDNIVILSAEQIAQISPYMTRWKVQNLNHSFLK